MSNDTRRAPRRPVTAQVPVFDQMTEAPIGRLGNVSESGMLLLTSVPVVEDALYQLRFPVPDRNGHETQIDVGAHLLWSEQAHAPGQAWAGFRFLTLDRQHRDVLRHWIEHVLPPH